MPSVVDEKMFDKHKERNFPPADEGWQSHIVVFLNELEILIVCCEL